MRLPLNISPARLFLYDLKQFLMFPCKNKKRDIENDDSCQDHVAHMNKKMDRVNNDNMDIINIMKIDRIE